MVGKGECPLLFDSRYIAQDITTINAKNCPLLMLYPDKVALVISKQWHNKN